MPTNTTESKFIYHLASNLTTTDAVNIYGKTGNESDIFVKTTENADNLLIGYKGVNKHGHLIVSPWDGDFERDHEDGHNIWTLNTAGGDDFVQVRDDQNAYTVAKFGTGNDTYHIGNTLDADYHTAQNDDSARGYVFMEEGNDIVSIQGSINGGRIYAGSGSDYIYVNGEIDKGGVIDLGAGKTKYANGHAEANSVDTKDDVNTLIVKGDLGKLGNTNFAKVYGGAGKDIVTVKDNIQGKSVIDLADNNDEITVDSIQHDAKILTANDDDKVTLNGSMFNNTVIDTSGEYIEAKDAVPGTPDRPGKVYDYDLDEYVDIIIPGTPGIPAVEGRSDDDIVHVKGSTYNNSSIEVGDGINIIKIGEDVDDYSTIHAGKHQDTLIVGDDLEDYSQTDLGAGDNLIHIKSSIKDHSKLTTGDDDDKLTVNHVVTGHSVVNLGAGNNDITIGDDLEGNATIITKAGDDIVKIHDDIEWGAKLLLGEGNNVISVADQIGGHSTIKTGAGNDVLKVGYILAGHALVDLGDGNNTISIGDDLDFKARVKTGNGNDVVTIGADIEDFASLYLGDNDDILTVKSKIEDESKVYMGDGNDTVTVEDAVLNTAKVYLGAGDDTMTVNNGIYNSAMVDGGQGNDTLTIGNLNGKAIYSTLDNITNVETINLVGKTQFEVSLHDLVQDASDNGIFINGTKDTSVEVNHLQKQDTQKTVNGNVYDVYSNTHHGNEHYVYIQQDVHVI